MTKRFLAILLLFHAAAAQGQVPVSVKVGPPVEFSITMTTSVVVPDGDRQIDQVRVYHALPTKRAWDGSPESSGAAQFSFEPKFAKVNRHDKTNSDYLLWTSNDGLEAGKQLIFTTKMTVSSPSRTFDPSTAKVNWKDYDQPAADPSAVVDPAYKPNPTLAEVAAGLKAGRTPPEAVAAFCQWVQKNIRYDASVPFDSTDLASLVKERRGHCGHMAAAVKNMTHSTGIPMRGVVGMNLKTPDGRSDKLHAIRADYSNVHTWTEVWFPGVGWVEAEPSRGAKAFSIPAEYVQNNRWFQNKVLWYREDKKNKMHEWTMSNGKYHSDWQLENTISFTKRK